MTRRIKLLSSLSALALTGALALSACGSEGEGEGEGAEGEGAVTTNLASEGEGEGEGEGAESEGEGSESEGEGAESEGEGGEGDEGASGSGNPATDDVEYITRLGLVRGHLIAFIELYRAGAVDAAMPHAKHPDSELYADLVPAFTARNEPGFAGPLTALNEAVTSNGDIETAYGNVVDAIAANMPKASVASNLLAISKMVTNAADEFAIGVDDNGAITNAHEYQDAYGFLTAARDMLTSLETTDVNETEAINLAHEQLDLALASFDGLAAETTEGTASTLYGAAARIEIAGLGLKRG